MTWTKEEAAAWNRLAESYPTVPSDWLDRDWRTDDEIVRGVPLVEARDPIPPADVQVTKDSSAPDHHRDTVTVTRPGANRGEPKTYTGEGSTPAEATRDVFRKFLDDPAAGEFHAHRKPTSSA